jgi:hypothetical protein
VNNSSTNALISRDGFTNSPRYTGFLTPPYKRYLKDDSGAYIDLTGVLPSAFALTMVNQRFPLHVKVGGGAWTILDTTKGEFAYAYAEEDLADAGNWYLFVTVQLQGEPTPRVFDPDLMTINIFPGGNPIVTIQDINMSELNGAQISPSNPVPTSGPITIADGADIAQGATTDSSSASTQIGLLKAIKAYLAGTLTTTTTINGNVTEANSAAILIDSNSLVTSTGAPGDAAWSGTGNGSEIAILKKLVAELAATLNVSVTNFPATQTVAGSVSVSNFPGTQPTTTTQPDTTTTGTITAAQPVIGTPVSNATVTIALGTGQSIWGAVVSGAFSVGSTIVVDHSRDGGTTWIASSFKVSGALQSTPVQSVVGGATLELNGNDAGVSHLRVRCSVLQGGDSIAVSIRAGYGIGSIGILSSIPAGSNSIGSVVTSAQSVVSGSGASTTTASTDYSYTFAQKVNHFGVQNNTTANLAFALDQSAASGGFIVQPGQMLILDNQVTVLHLYTTLVASVNSGFGSNIVVYGWL